MEMGVAAERPQALLWRESEEKLSQFDVVRVGRRLGADSHSLATSHRKPLERLPGGRCGAALVAGHGGLRSTGPAREGTLGKAGT